MEVKEGRKMLHLFIQKEGTERVVLMDALALDEEDAKQQIPPEFRFVRFAESYSEARHSE